MLTTGVSSKMRAPARLACVGQAVDVFPSVDLERARVMDTVEIPSGAELLAHAIDLPSLDFGLEILAQRLQSADQRFAGVDIGNFQRALTQRNARHGFLGGGGANIVGAQLRQRPQFARIVEADALDQFADRKAISRHDRAKLMA